MVKSGEFFCYALECICIRYVKQLNKVFVYSPVIRTFAQDKFKHTYI